MVDYTKKSRNIHHKTLKLHGGAKGLQNAFRSYTKLEKELPTFANFYDGFNASGSDIGAQFDHEGHDNLYEIQYLNDPTKKYDAISLFSKLPSIGERKNFLSLGNAYFIGTGTGEIQNGKAGLPADFSMNATYYNISSNNFAQFDNATFLKGSKGKYIVFELIDDRKYAEPVKNFFGYDISDISLKTHAIKDNTKNFSNDAAAEQKIIKYRDNTNNLDRFFVIIYESENCYQGGNEEARKGTECANDDLSRYFSHYIIKPKNKTIADFQSRFASGNRINSITDAVRRIFGPDSYLTIFKNEKFLPFMNDALQAKFKGCKDIGSQLCKDLNEKNSEFTRTTDLKKTTGKEFRDSKFKPADFKNINYLRLLFAIKYHYTKALDLGRMDIIAIIFYLFKIYCLNDDEKQEIFNKKLQKSEGLLKMTAFMQNNAKLIPGIADMIGKVLLDAPHWYLFRDVRLSKDNIKSLVDMKDKLEKEINNVTTIEEDVAVAIDIANDTVVKGGRSQSFDDTEVIKKGNTTHKLVGGKQSKDFVANLVIPQLRFKEITIDKITDSEITVTNTDGTNITLTRNTSFLTGDFNRFTKYKVKSIMTTRLGALGTVQSTNKLTLTPSISELFHLQSPLRGSLVDNNIFIKLINKYININEFEDADIYEDSIQNMLVGTLVSFFLKMYELNYKDQSGKVITLNKDNIHDLIRNKIKPYLISNQKDKKETTTNDKIDITTKLEQYILNLYQILYIYYRRNFKYDKKTYDDASADEEAPDSHLKITEFIQALVDLAQIAKPEEEKPSLPETDPANIALTAPLIDPVQFMLRNVEFINKKKVVVDILKQIIISKYKDPDIDTKTRNTPIVESLFAPLKILNKNVTHSLYMLYDFHDIVEFFHFKNVVVNPEDSFAKNAVDKIGGISKQDKYAYKIIGQNYPIIQVLSDSELISFIDKNLYIEYIFVVNEWIKELVKNVGTDQKGKEEIADFMITIADCVALGAHLKCSSGLGLVGPVLSGGVLFGAISATSTLAGFQNIQDPRCVASGILLVRTVMSEWLDRETLLQFSKKANQTIQEIKAQRDKIEAAKKEEKEKVVVKSISSKEPMCYVQFETNFKITFIYIQHTDGENNIFYIKHDNAGSPITDVKPIPKADIIKYLVSTNSSGWIPSSQPNAKPIGTQTGNSFSITKTINISTLPDEELTKFREHIKLNYRSLYDLYEIERMKDTVMIKNALTMIKEVIESGVLDSVDTRNESVLKQIKQAEGIKESFDELMKPFKAKLQHIKNFIDVNYDGPNKFKADLFSNSNEWVDDFVNSIIRIFDLNGKNEIEIDDKDTNTDYVSGNVDVSTEVFKKYPNIIESINVEFSEAVDPKFLNQSDWKVKDTVGDGTCLLHYVMNGLSPTYTRLSRIDKELIGQSFRYLIGKITDDEWSGIFNNDENITPVLFTRERDNGSEKIDDNVFKQHASVFLTSGNLKALAILLNFNYIILNYISPNYGIHVEQGTSRADFGPFTADDANVPTICAVFTGGHYSVIKCGDSYAITSATAHSSI